jgi:hypothetical protein
MELSCEIAPTIPAIAGHRFRASLLPQDAAGFRDRPFPSLLPRGVDYLAIENSHRPVINMMQRPGHSAGGVEFRFRAQTVAPRTAQPIIPPPLQAALLANPEEMNIVYRITIGTD